MDNFTGQNGMSKSTLEKVIAALSYSPALFGIFFLMTSRETEDSYEDKSGVSGILAGLACIAYGLCAGAASSGCPADFCKVLVLARLALGVISLLAGIFILALGDETDKALKFVLMYIFFALMTVPEAGTFYMYVRQVQLEKFMAENAEPQLQAYTKWSGSHQVKSCAINRPSNNGLQGKLERTMHSKGGMSAMQAEAFVQVAHAPVIPGGARLAPQGWTFLQFPSFLHPSSPDFSGVGAVNAPPSRPGQAAAAAAIFALGAFASQQRHNVGRRHRQASVVELAPGAWPAESITHPSEVAKPPQDLSEQRKKSCAELKASGAEVWPAPKNDRLLRRSIL
eukprot:symbB.v1.2.036910.t1/scaffold5315.1/size28482/2